MVRAYAACGVGSLTVPVRPLGPEVCFVKETSLAVPCSNDAAFNSHLAPDFGAETKSLKISMIVSVHKELYIDALGLCGLVKLAFTRVQ